ncbi:uncharacterized protein LOC111244975 isoform X5 [Varroa destructor]|uniref:Uncharacterized protein n=1 Tax=Varroa destructor TaxID=109461 RepID=A0A7M7J9V0_VARDE|nr:uncharacterized protein LOC111244975 isoform X5 [Varroa destructor]
MDAQCGQSLHCPSVDYICLIVPPRFCSRSVLRSSRLCDTIRSVFIQHAFKREQFGRFWIGFLLSFNKLHSVKLRQQSPLVTRHYYNDYDDDNNQYE